MHKLIPGLLLLLLPLLSASQTGYWQQEVQYTIDVSLNDADHTLNGFEKIKYTNHSPDTLRFIWFHIWPNAYKNDRTAFTDQELEKIEMIVIVINYMILIYSCISLYSWLDYA